MQRLFELIHRLMMPSSRTVVQLARVLLEGGANSLSKGADGVTPADVAQDKRHFEMIKLLGCVFSLMVAPAALLLLVPISSLSSLHVPAGTASPE